MIRAEHLTKTFGGMRAVDDVSFDVRRGEVVGFLGPNGAGKTTTLRMLAGVFPPTAGRATIDGFDVTTQVVAARRQVGYFPERIALYLDMTVRGYLEYVGAIKDIAGRSRRLAADSVMERCGVAQMANRAIGTLSKGYRQRIGLAQALIGSPQALLLDEPTAGLDPEHVVEIRALIRALAKERAILLSSHILAEVELSCDRVIVLGAGRVIGQGPPAALAQRFRRVSRVIVEVEGPHNALVDVLRSVAGVRGVRTLSDATSPVARVVVETDPETDLRRDLVRAVISAGFVLVEIYAEPLSLEDAFLALVGRDAARQ